MKEIGGFFELEYKNDKEYYNDAIALNSGRNALKYILLSRKIQRIFIPYYICDVLIDTINSLNIKYEFYSIDNNLNPIFSEELFENDYFLIINYFGIYDAKITIYKNKFHGKLIVDNSQAFFSKPIKGVDTFYSVRKFFGVSDGAYLFTDKDLNIVLPKDESSDRITHLIGRLASSATDYYKDYLINEKILSNQDLKFMSDLTKRLLSGIDYSNVIKRRKDNFTYVHSKLSVLNILKFSVSTSEVPMVYPFLINRGFLIKQKLIRNQIYIPTYWSSVKNYVSKDSFEFFLSENLISLPIDQRYTNEDMDLILKIILNECKY